MSSASSKTADVFLKVVFLGATRTGKTTLLNRLVNQCTKPEKDYQPTIGVDFCTKEFDVNEKKVKCQIWDTAGQERFQALLNSYVKSSPVVVFVYSIDDQSSFERVKKLYEEFKNFRDENGAVYYLIANKADLITHRQVLRVDGESFAQSANMTYVEMCGNELKEVNEFFENLVHNYVSKFLSSGTLSSSRSFSRLNREKLESKTLSSNIIDSSRSLNLDSRTSVTAYSTRTCQKIDVNSNSVLLSGTQSARRSSNDVDATRLIQEVRILTYYFNLQLITL